MPQRTSWARICGIIVCDATSSLTSTHSTHNPTFHFQSASSSPPFCCCIFMRTHTHHSHTAYRMYCVRYWCCLCVVMHPATYTNLPSSLGLSVYLTPERQRTGCAGYDISHMKKPRSLTFHAFLRLCV
ncbi:hypothetical protein B0T20DRAFT_146785 [Sordaria brevicollis]|uniref:Uncharacterized protein n=1 Tax=Sordaria brevicollis TaxID=83679 RepID=A0AAE0PIB2_SORBR|nr:hypothetical protein B0T20DRAFT_146785 [Sordaria brevicollis]